MFELKQKEISVDKANLAAVCAGMLLLVYSLD